MHGLDSLLIPTQLKPVSEDVQVMFAQIATSLGRDHGLRADVGMRLPVSHGNNARNSTPQAHNELPWWCQCGQCLEDDVSANTCAQTSPPGTGPSQVELSLLLPSASGPTHYQAPLRRRHRDTSDSQPDTTLGSDLSPRAQHPHQLPEASPGCTALGPGTAAASFFSSLGKVIRESAMVQKVKQMSGPSASGYTRASLGEAAEGVLASLRHGLLPKGTLSMGRQDLGQLHAAAALNACAPSQNKGKKGE